MIKVPQNSLTGTASHQTALASARSDSESDSPASETPDSPATDMQHRIGIGHDTHRLEAGRDLFLGGVRIPHDLGCIAHSDGDVLLHALTDAILGALAWGDIGEWFPDTDPTYKGADSGQLLGHVLEKVSAAGWQIVNADCIIFAQRPKLAQTKLQIRDRVAALLNVEASQVNVKAKTGEHVGPIGRQEAISAEVVVLLTHS